jgi:hypothetical protein
VTLTDVMVGDCGGGVLLLPPPPPQPAKHNAPRQITASEALLPMHLSYEAKLSWGSLMDDNSNTGEIDLGLEPIALRKVERRGLRAKGNHAVQKTFGKVLNLIVSLFTK